MELYYRNGMITIVSGTKQSTVTLMESEYTHENYGHLIYWCTIGKCMHALSLLINLSFNTYPPCDISRHFFVHGIYSIIYFSGSSVSAPDNIILYQLIKTIYMVFPPSWGKKCRRNVTLYALWIFNEFDQHVCSRQVV